MKSSEYVKVMQIILQMIDEGIHVVDKNKKTVIYNEAMADLEKMQSKDVLAKPFSEAFKNIDLTQSTLMQALTDQNSTIRQQQTYINNSGQQITTINTTVPVIVQNEVIAAIEVAKNITQVSEMSHAIMALRKEIDSDSSTKERKIKQYKFENIIGKNQEFLRVIHMAKKAAKSTASVVIYGETGTGKELIAQSIHFDSKRKSHPFIAQNCAALPESLLEGILFGTAKGGFTDAVDRAGLFEQADGGTLLLDEINTMPYDLQGKLLRVLQEDYCRRVGGTKDIPVDVRIIATTNEKPSALIEAKKLRKDLFYRMNIIPIEIPPLRERTDDILLLAENFREKYNAKYGKNLQGFSLRAKEKLLGHDYPGNVRELENIIMGAMSMSENDDILSEQYIITGSTEAVLPVTGKEYFGESGIGLDGHLEHIERNILREAMILHGGNVSHAAAYLKIKRQTLQHKLRKYNIQ